MEQWLSHDCSMKALRKGQLRRVLCHEHVPQQAVLQPLDDQLQLVQVLLVSEHSGCSKP